MPRAKDTRTDILDAALRLASLEGLEAVTIGRLATELGLSKAGLFGHFGSKENLQVAAVAYAAEEFRAEVFEPALALPSGLARLRAFAEKYFAYLEARVSTGGCFFTAAALEFDDRPGPVRDAILTIALERQQMLVGAVEEAIRGGELDARTDAEQLVFEAVSLLQGAVLTYQMIRDSAVLERARRALAKQLERAQKVKRRTAASSTAGRRS